MKRFKKHYFFPRIDVVATQFARRLMRPINLPSHKCQSEDGLEPLHTVPSVNEEDAAGAAVAAHPVAIARADRYTPFGPPSQCHRRPIPEQGTNLPILLRSRKQKRRVRYTTEEAQMSQDEFVSYRASRAVRKFLF